MVVNCFQILYIRSLNTMPEARRCEAERLWIAFRFCIFVLWTQSWRYDRGKRQGCELLSDFVYSFFEHNTSSDLVNWYCVVNCFQILYIRSLNTIMKASPAFKVVLWIAFRFCIFVLWTQSIWNCWMQQAVVNCFQILYIRSLNTIGFV